MDLKTGHYPVLLHESVSYLNVRGDGIYLDGTFGMGGHSSEILSQLVTGTLIAFDKDPYAIERGKKRFSGAGDRIIFVNEDFRNICGVLDRLGIEKVDGMLFDLGVSSPQLDNAYRGFSYMKDAPLDMRMD
ncbi:MAG: 16S rRNA (cytosine(1402)-N(4))-methyltransferase RsmH, partial [Oscillospiraceae bacterium]|nr:16S rRNA (cytosine(1402)-N(4))-methyltransferase RsmH [Oscillospiraceae bacterium]